MFSKFKLIISIFIVAFLFVGCVPKTKPLFNYNEYSDSYYAYKKKPSEESALKLQKAIEDAIEKAGESRTGKVPPGMYANLGYLYLKAGNSKEAIISFEKEKNEYPESAHFMNRIIAKVEAAEGTEK